MRFLISALLALAASVACAQAPTFAAPDFTALVRDAGADPCPTDFIAFVRGAPAATRVSVAPAPVHDR